MKQYLLRTFCILALNIGIIPLEVYAQEPVPEKQEVKTVAKLQGMSETLKLVATLPAHPVRLSFDRDTLFASMGFGGVGWIDQSEAAIESGEAEFHIDEEIKALEVTRVRDEFLFVGDRLGKISIYNSPEGSETFSDLVTSIDIEGHPVQLDSTDELIAIGAGSAGASFWRFNSTTKIVNLVSRYPFPDYVRDILFLDEDHVAVTDVQGAELVILDVSDRLRPQPVLELPLGGGYCDQVLYHEGKVYTHNRLSNIYEFDLSDDFSNMDNVRFSNIKTLLTHNRQIIINEMIAFDEFVLVLEKTDGIIVYSPEEAELVPRSIFTLDEPMICMTRHPSKPIVYIGTMNGNIYSVELKKY